MRVIFRNIKSARSEIVGQVFPRSRAKFTNDKRSKLRLVQSVQWTQRLYSEAIKSGNILRLAKNISENSDEHKTHTLLRIKHKHKHIHIQKEKVKCLLICFKFSKQLKRDYRLFNTWQQSKLLHFINFGTQICTWNSKVLVLSIEFRTPTIFILNQFIFHLVSMTKIVRNIEYFSLLIKIK